MCKIISMWVIMMEKKTNIITNIVVVIFIVLGIVGISFIISEYSDVVENDIASRNYLQQDSITRHEMETDICIAINLGKNSTALDNTEEIDEYVQKINNSMNDCRELLKKYEAIPKTSEEDKQYHLVKTAMNQYDEIISNEILTQIVEKHYETANTIYYDRFINKRNGLDDSLNSLLYITDESINSRYDKVVRNTKLLCVFFTLFGIILLGIINLLESRRKKAVKNLETAVDTNEKTQQSLNNAIFKDTVTDTGNRFSFVVEYGSNNVNVPSEEAYYFIMFDIKDFSGINIRFGSDAGDKLLVATVDKLKDVYDGASIYRTGSDEFVVVVKASDGVESMEKITRLTERAYGSLTSDNSINNYNVRADYDIAVVKKSGPSVIDMTIHNVLKQTMTEGTSSASGHWKYSEAN